MEIPYAEKPREDIPDPDNPGEILVVGTGLYNGKAGIWLFLASEVMLFGALFSAYVLLRVGADPGTWSMGLMNKWIGAFNTLILIASSVTVVLAWICLKMDDFAGFRKFKWWTIIFAAMFLCVKWSYEWPDKFTHYDIKFANQYRITIKDPNGQSAKLAKVIHGIRPELGSADEIKAQLENGRFEFEGGRELKERLEKIGGDKKPVVGVSKEPVKLAREAAHEFFKNAYLTGRIEEITRRITEERTHAKKENRAEDKELIGVLEEKIEIGKKRYRSIVMVQYYQRYGRDSFRAIFGWEFLDLFKKPGSEKSEMEISTNGWVAIDVKKVNQIFDDADKPVEKIPLSGHITAKRDEHKTAPTPNKFLWIRECWLWRKKNMEGAGVLGINFHADGSETGQDKGHRTSAAQHTDNDADPHSHGHHHGVYIHTDQMRRIISYEPGHSTFFATYFTLTGLHALHVLGGIIVMCYHLLPISVRVWNHSKDQFANRIEITGLFWHFVDLVWIFLFPILYLL